jgi:subtilase family serine protease
MASIPQNYSRLEGSERHPAPGAKLLGPADDNETFTVTIVLRRRPDGPPAPDHAHFLATGPVRRGRMSADEFAAKYGAHPDELAKVADFAKSQGLTVVETNAARRTVVVSGTVAQMSKAFAVELGRYEHSVAPGGGEEPQTEAYRGREGFIHVPRDLADITVGVFGLDNRGITKRNSNTGDPANTTTLTVQQVRQFYNFPANSAAGETIGIASPKGGRGGYFQSDLQQYFGSSMPTITPISADGATNNGSILIATTVPTATGSNVLTFASTAGILVNSVPFSPDLIVTFLQSVKVTALTSHTVTLNQPVLNDIPAGTQIYFNTDIETTQDICIAASAAPGAAIAVYFSTHTQQGWVDLIDSAVHPLAGDPICSVLSCSFAVADGDDAHGLALRGITTAWVDAMSSAFQDAAIQGVTVCVASGDTGSDSKIGATEGPNVGDGKAHVQYPGSDPWVLSIGGTTIGNVSGTSFDEYVWNDTFNVPFPSSGTGVGATGGGISDYFVPKPSYQNNAGVPGSLNDGHDGRGVPDVAANASPNSGYPITVGGKLYTASGTSASAPLWAALIAVINAALGTNVGFVNPRLYALGSRPFRDIVGAPGPADNGLNGIAGYPAGPGWDACTGWGSPNGAALLKALNPNPIGNAIWLLAVLVTPNPLPDPALPPTAWFGSNAPSSGATPTQPLYSIIHAFLRAIFTASPDMQTASNDIKSALADVASVLGIIATNMPMTGTALADFNNAMTGLQNSLALAQSLAPGSTTAVLTSASGLFQQLQAQLTAIANTGAAGTINQVVAELAQLSQLITALAGLFPPP